MSKLSALELEVDRTLYALARVCIAMEEGRTEGKGMVELMDECYAEVSPECRHAIGLLAERGLFHREVRRRVNELRAPLADQDVN